MTTNYIDGFHGMAMKNIGRMLNQKSILIFRQCKGKITKIYLYKPYFAQLR